MNEKTHVSIIVYETKQKLIDAIMPIAKESALPPSVLNAIIGEIVSEMKDSALLEMRMLYNDLQKTHENMVKQLEEAAEKKEA